MPAVSFSDSKRTAGQIAVPLSVPLGGVVDERVNSVMDDASPSVVLTTSSVAGVVADHVKLHSGASGPLVVEVDMLDLDAPAGSGAVSEDHPSTAYLQYTSGSTRAPGRRRDVAPERSREF